MKKTSLIIIMAFLMSLGLYAARYEVFRIKGDVKIENGGKWDALSAHTPLDGSSKLKIASGSSIGIKDNETKSIYYGSGPEEVTVVRLIMSAKKGMQSKTSTIVKTLGRAVASDAPRRKAVLGVTNRGGAGSAADNDENHEIKAGTLEYLIRALARGESAVNIEFPYDVEWRITMDPDSVVGYDIALSPLQSADSSATICGLPGQDEFYFLNVLKINDKEAPRLIFQSGSNGENISIAPGERINVDWFPTIFDPQARYLLLVSESPYRAELLQNIMNSIHNGKINAKSRLPIDRELRQSLVWVFGSGD